MRISDWSSDVCSSDLSTAHRVATGWTYGFPELEPGLRQQLSSARFVSNPGCYPTGFLALVRPLIRGGLIPADWPLTANAVSGYSGGGKAMIAAFEDPDAPESADTALRAYGLDLAHKHVPEMQKHSGAKYAPLFTPAVARSEEHTSELQSLMRISYAVFCLKKKKNNKHDDIPSNKNTQQTQL